MTEPESAVTVQLATAAQGLPAGEQLAAWAHAVLAREGREGAELVLRVVDEAEGAALNRTYRQGERATNVLSFPVELPEGPVVDVAGDIVICAEVVRREAAEQDKPELAHWAHMVVHGTLHLLGYDHSTDAEAAVMEPRERAILAELGFGDPYRGEAAD